jgi:hypothetical protein
MTIERKLVKTSGATAEAVYVEDVFSTYLYTGNSSTQTITNGIDLSTKGGLVWVKPRSAGFHNLYDTLRGTNSILYLNTTDAAEAKSPPPLSSYNTNGFTLDAYSGGNSSGTSYASWTFRKQPKFFDVVTFTGNGGMQTISHSLGSAPGMVIIKTTGITDDWYTYHRSIPNAFLKINSVNAQNTEAVIIDTVSSTSIRINGTYLGTSGKTYVAYLFAHDAGGFGAAGTDSVVSCGSYTGNGSATGPTVTLGWEPQYILVKNASSTGDWNIFDNMRGIPTGSADPYLFANTSAAEATTNGDLIDLTATGFQIKSTNSQVNTSGNLYIYLAIRRGPMKTPTDATKVFAPIASNTVYDTAQTTNFPIDAQIFSKRAGGDPNNLFIDRLRGISSNTTQALGPFLQTWSTRAESTTNSTSLGWSNTGFRTFGFIAGYAAIFYNFRRAPGFFDVVCYTGTSSTNNVVPHNLGVSPELVILKSRSLAYSWMIYHKVLGNTNNLYNFQNAAPANYNAFSSSPTSTTITLANQGDINTSNSTNVAYLFASCPGVSKVGSYTGNGSSQTIDCGFAAGARFVLIKRTNSTGDWYVWDTARGIVSGNDPYLLLGSTDAEVTTNDTIDPASSGFIVNQVDATNVNVSSGTYIYLAIA